MKAQQHTDKAEKFAEAHEMPGHGNGQDTAAAWAAVAAWAVAEANREWHETPAPRILAPGLPNPRLPGVGPLPGP